MVRPTKRKAGESDAEGDGKKPKGKRPHRLDEEDEVEDDVEVETPPKDDDEVPADPEEIAAQAKLLRDQATEQVAYDVQLQEKAAEMEEPPPAVIDKDSLLYRSLFKKASEPKNKAAILYVAWQEGRLPRAPTVAELVMKASLASAVDAGLNAASGGAGDVGSKGSDVDNEDGEEHERVPEEGNERQGQEKKKKKMKKKVKIVVPSDSDSSDSEAEDYETDYEGASTKLRKKKKARRPPSSSSSTDSSEDEARRRKRRSKKKKKKSGGAKASQARSLVLHAAALRAKADKKKKKKKRAKRRHSSSSSSDSSSAEDKPAKEKVNETRANWIHPFTPLVKSVPGEKETTPEVQSKCFYFYFYLRRNFYKERSVLLG